MMTMPYQPDLGQLPSRAAHCAFPMLKFSTKGINSLQSDPNGHSEVSTQHLELQVEQPTQNTSKPVTVTVKPSPLNFEQTNLKARWPTNLTQ
jgi:hypothetical protein